VLTFATTRRPQRLNLGGVEVQYHHLKEELFFGYTMTDGLYLAEPEKALLEDGTEGIVDVSKIVEFTGVFAPLRERAFFLQVRVNPELGTICWPNEADINERHPDSGVFRRHRNPGHCVTAKSRFR
jgi:hypothetical protein